MQEANALVPRISMLIGRLQQVALRLGRDMRDLASADGLEIDTLTTADLLRRRPEAGGLIEELDEIVREIGETGAELKDIQLGLVDFPAEQGGERVLLCWQFGEPEIAFWHRPSEGFAGRQPLVGGARPPQLQ